MPDILDFCRHRPAFPAAAGNDELAFGQPVGGIEKELVDPRLAVWKPIAEKAEVRPEPIFRGHRVMGRRIKPVIDGNAAPRAERLIGVDDRRSTTISEHKRSEERRVGKECVSTCRSRWSPDK